jgi:pSer/pThr/pTyr-binding forkhead associated (FHA) protein/peptidoglycan hydrolase CwlO-like protein
MATQHDTPTTVDLEETAELPILPGASTIIGADDPMGATDSWMVSPAAMRASSSGQASAAARPSDTIGRDDATNELRIEQRLRDAEIGALRSDLASVTESRGQLENNLGNLTTNLRELEQLLNRKSEQLSMFEREVGLRDRRIAELESQGATIGGEYAAASAERDTLRADLKAAREEAAAAHAAIESHDASASASLKERQLQARRLRVVEVDLAQTRSHAERFRENLQSLEGRRQVFEAMLGDREAVISERGQRLAALEREIAERIKLHAAHEENLVGKIKAGQEQVAKLEAEAIAMRSEQEQQLAAAAAAEKVALERHVALEAEVRSQAHNIGDLRAQLEAVRTSLEQRDSLIKRLETATASSAAVLGNIQQNLEHLGDAEPTRMLVRTQGETGIVQLLGRRTTIGRTPDNDIRIDAEFISRHHAVVLLYGTKTVIEDLNSTNGTFVNAERINRRTLKEGDIVTLGKSEFRFVIRTPPERAPQERGS